MDPDVPPNLCYPGKSSVAEAVARITGKQMGAVEDLVAAVHCARSLRTDYQKYDYLGYGACSGANLAFAGPTDCQFGCVGFGECAAACHPVHLPGQITRSLPALQIFKSLDARHVSD